MIASCIAGPACARSRSTTQAFTRSTCAGSGTPITHVSATAGCSRITASTCAGYTLKPEDLIMRLSRTEK